MCSAWRGRSFSVVCACLFFCSLIPAQVVTDTKLVENWDEKGTPPEVLRKINGRWWTEDNREVNPPGKGGGFWIIDSKPGVCQFFHHRPFRLERAESLHLWMTPQEVEAALGQPNRTFGRDQHAFWSYYAANGTKLVVRFMGDDGLLGEATYEPIGEKSRSVASIERELNGQNIYKLMADRAWKKVQEHDSAQRQAFQNAHRRGAAFGTPRPSVVTVESVPVPRAADEQPSAPARVISAMNWRRLRQAPLARTF